MLSKFGCSLKVPSLHTLVFIPKTLLCLVSVGFICVFLYCCFEMLREKIGGSGG